LLPETDRSKAIWGLSAKEAKDLLYSWKFLARDKQLPPPGDWRTWMIRAGRGWGKDWTGSNWTNSRAGAEPRWIALIAKTPAEARDFMIEGPAGILKQAHPDALPKYEPSKRRITWSNGTTATVFSSEDPDQLRGFSGDTAWIDELSKFKNPKEVWDNLQFGMREASSDIPRTCITMTPKPLQIIKDIESLSSTVVTVGSSYENRANLAPSWFDEVLAGYEGTETGRQEIYADLLEEAEGALWKRAWIDGVRIQKAPELVRVVVAIDPAVTSTENGWAKRAIGLLASVEGDRIIGEVNNGGDMIESTLRTQEQHVPYKAVNASRGKRTRAEPIAAMYQQGRIHHVGIHPELEDQMCSWEPAEGQKSPDRMDAVVWALTELFPMKGSSSVRWLS